MDAYKETARTWNKIAALYQEKFMGLDMYNTTYDLFCAAVGKAGARVLEIGCGPGNITRYLLQQRPDFQITGIDIAPNMVSLAKKNVPEATFMVKDCRSLQPSDGCFDAIVCGFCLPYLQAADGAQLLAVCSQLLPLGGVLYLSFVAGHSSLSGYKTSTDGDRVYFNYYEMETLADMLHSNGFSLTQTIQVPFPRPTGTEEHTVLLAMKVADAIPLQPV